MEIAIIYLDLLARTNKTVGFFAGRLSTIGFDNQMAATVESVTYDVVASSEMEGGHSIRPRCVHPLPANWG